MDDGRVSYEEAAEAIRKWGNMVHDFTLPDARLWCSNTNHSLSDMEEAVGNIRYGQTETLNHVPRHEKKRPWPYHLVAFLNEVIDMFVQAVTEDFL